jgi:hypothetical protein
MWKSDNVTYFHARILRELSLVPYVIEYEMMSSVGEPRNP